MMPLSKKAIQAQLTTRIFGQTLYYYPQIGSTNTELKKLANEGAPEGLLVIADEQVAGRGRFNRVWQAPPGSSLLMSLLFRPTFLSPAHGQQLTMICTLAAVDAIALETGVAIDLKWPNDLIYQERKLAGVLTELSLAGDKFDWAVVGVGLNVNLDFHKLSQPSDTAAPPLWKTATSLQMIVGRPVSRLRLLQSYLACVEARYDALRSSISPYNDWVQSLVTLGQVVTISDHQATFQGLAEAVAEDGALLVRRDDGQLVRVLTGDVTLSARH